MKTKSVFQVLTVCFSLTLLGGYVIYAQRRAQPAAPAPLATAAVDLPADVAFEQAVREGFIQYPPDESSQKIGTVLAPSSKRISEVFTSGQTPAGPVPKLPPSPSNPQPRVQWTQNVSQRVDGSTVTTRVGQGNSPAMLAPSSKVLVGVIPPPNQISRTTPVATSASPPAPVLLPSGVAARPETIHHPQPLSLVGVISPPTPPGKAPPAPDAAPNATPPGLELKGPPTYFLSTKSAPVFTSPAPTPAVPSPAIAQPAAGTPVPAKPRLMAPGSKSIDLRLFQQGIAPGPTPANSPIAAGNLTAPTAPIAAPVSTAVSAPATQATLRKGQSPKTP